MEENTFLLILVRLVFIVILIKVTLTAARKIHEQQEDEKDYNKRR